MLIFDRARWLPYTFLAVAVLGFADASYLTAKHFSGTAIPCSLTHGCEIVTTSVYATPLGIPVALLGTLYYLAVIGLTFVAIDARSQHFFRIATRLTLIGFLSSIWFVFVQVGILHAICQWCMISAVTSTILFVLGYIVTPRLIKHA